MWRAFLGATAAWPERKRPGCSLPFKPANPLYLTATNTSAASLQLEFLTRAVDSRLTCYNGKSMKLSSTEGMVRGPLIWRARTELGRDGRGCEGIF